MCNQFSVGIIIYNPDKYSLIISPRTCASSRLKPFIQSPAFASPFRVFRVSRLAAIWSRLCFKYSISFVAGTPLLPAWDPYCFPFHFLIPSGDPQDAHLSHACPVPPVQRCSANCPHQILCPCIPLTERIHSHRCPRFSFFKLRFSQIPVIRFSTIPTAHAAICPQSTLQPFRHFPHIRVHASNSADTPEAPDISCPRVSFTCRPKEHRIIHIPKSAFPAAAVSGQSGNSLDKCQKQTTHDSCRRIQHNIARIQLIPVRQKCLRCSGQKP